MNKAQKVEGGRGIISSYISISLATLAFFGVFCFIFQNRANYTVVSRNLYTGKYASFDDSSYRFFFLYLAQHYFK